MNKLLIAAAGAGKTTFLVDEAKKIKNENVLITTYTETNESEIRIKFSGYIPRNITIQPWFSFLLRHGVKPYQSILNGELHDKKIGFYLSERASGIYKTKNGKITSYGEENNFFDFYFTKDMKIYSDKISKFIIKCNEKTKGEIINRVSRIYPYIFIDEIQDLAGWELEILILLFKSNSNLILVGDPRQVTYLTHHPKKYKKYKDGKIKDFIEKECNTKKEKICEIDETSLNKSHRNNYSICCFSSKLYPDFPVSEPCDCCKKKNVDHQGVFLVRPGDKEEYCEKYKPQILKYKEAKFPEMNFGISKGLSFDRVLIYPTKKIKDYLKDGDVKKIASVRAKFYVALTRARYSIGILYDYSDDVSYIDGLTKYK